MQKHKDKNCIISYKNNIIYCLTYKHTQYYFEYIKEVLIIL